MKKIILTLIFITSLIYSQKINLDYFGQKPPRNIPEIFAPGIVSIDSKNSHALMISPDGNTIIFSRYPDRTSFILTKGNNEWSELKESFFYGKEVSFSPDGKKVYYYTGGDIFYVEKKEGVWSSPYKLTSNINSSDQVEYYPSVTANGNLYFSRNGNWTEARIMLSKFINGEFQKAEDLGLPVNKGGALHGFVAPDESYILFNSPRPGSYTQCDIWISFRKIIDTWDKPINVGKKINSGADAIICPTVSPDGKYMFFTKLNFSTNTGYIYWVSTEFIKKLRNKSGTKEEIN